MREPCLIERLAVPGGGLYIDVLRPIVLRNHRERSPTILLGIQMQCRLVYNGAADGVDAAAGIDRIEPQSTEYVPCRHLSAVHISTLSGRFVVIFQVHDLPHMLLGLVGLSSIIVKIRDVVA